MLNSKLWRAMASLSPTEVKQMSWFLESPYHNRRGDTISLFQYLKGCRKTGPPLEKKDVWASIFPEDPWSDPTFRHLSAYLLGLIEEFLAVNAFRKSEAIRITIAEEYVERGLSDLAMGVARKTQQKLRKENGLGTASLLSSFFLEHISFQAHEREKRSFTPGLQGISDSLDSWFLVQKLKLACTMGSQQKVFRAEYELGFLEPVLEMAARPPWSEQPLVALYARTFAMLHDKDANAYRDQVKLLTDHAALLNSDEQRTLSLMAINFCIRQLNQGLGEYLSEVYQLYKRGLVERWLFEHGQLSPWTYKNVVSAGLKLSDFDWTGQFIETYKEFLPPDLRFTFYQYNLAELQFAKGDFQSVLRTLRYLKIKDPLTQLRARLLQIKAGFELGEFQLLESLLENLRRLLQRKKELTYHREAYRNFERFLRKLMALAPSAESNAFLRDLDKAEIVAEKEWLLAKGKLFRRT